MKTVEEIEKILDENGVEYGRWTKKDMDRIYINNTVDVYNKAIGLELRYYKTGNISYASIHGEKISNYRANQLTLDSDETAFSGGKCWIDLKDNKVHVKNFSQGGKRLVKIIEEMLDN